MCLTSALRYRSSSTMVTEGLVSSCILFKVLDSTLLPSIEPCTSSSSTWSVIELWLQDCVDHDQCGSRNNSEFIPTRLLKLTVHESDCSFRVVSRSEVEAGSHYLTLSHCWGTQEWDEKLILTQSNKSSLEQEQSISILPNTFKDAFEVLKRLGERYLWIDRFCIQQDSLDDWRVESACMKEVYSNSYLNIAALGSDNDSGGCFYNRHDFSDLCLATVQVCWKSPHEPVTYRLRSTDASVIASWRGEPLLERAWVLQERFLSPRVLYFGSRQVFWECHSLHASELQPSLSLRKHEPSNLGKTLISLADYPETPQSQNNNNDLFRGWYLLLKEYTKLDLTNANDKLVAVSAIAKRLQNLLELAGLNSEYLAGIWKQQLPYSLLWYRVSGPGLTLSHECLKDTPSWSWAAVDARCVFLDSEDMRSNSTILVSSRVTTPHNGVTTVDQFTNTQGIELILSGTKMPARVYRNTYSDGGFLRIRSLGDIDPRFLQTKFPPTKVQESVIHTDHPEEHEYSGGGIVEQDVWCLPIVYSVYTDQEPEIRLYCLVLRPMEKSYKRIGLAVINIQEKAVLLEEMRKSPGEDIQIM
ncbi:unnamed protein product [Periconia digitata]|uniref:Heterokaryon incompatibility domain-containing protein n=1 Tax=Periconia digitata TaxID=1303443 RepID=A0A9W4XR51_9PLEO|nr:unnamed protein product [Periconia digitata]